MDRGTKIALGIGAATLAMSLLLGDYEKKNPRKKSACCGDVKRVFRRNTNFD